MHREAIRQKSEKDEAFLRRFTRPYEAWQWDSNWDGGYRWFRAVNVVPLELYRDEEAMTRIKARLLGLPEPRFDGDARKSKAR
jgi:hypothetical protein